MTERTLIEDLLVSGLDDPVYAGWIRAIAAQSALTDPGRLRELSLGIIVEVLCPGLMVPGDYDQDGHHPWPHSPGDAIERISREWLDQWAYDVPAPGAIVWLANTDFGNEVARHVLGREAAQ
jgi:hypothetical protein